MVSGCRSLRDRLAARRLLCVYAQYGNRDDLAGWFLACDQRGIFWRGNEKKGAETAQSKHVFKVSEEDVGSQSTVLNRLQAYMDLEAYAVTLKGFLNFNVILPCCR